jgi:hypothetical protein
MKRRNGSLLRSKLVSRPSIQPEATFTVTVGEDPMGIYLDAYTDATDGFAVLDVVSDWLVDLNVNEGLAIHVIPLPTQAR